MSSLSKPLHVEHYVVESGVPVPPRMRSGPKPLAGGGRFKYPFASMEVGDSFAYPAEDHPRVNTAAAHFGRRNSMKFRVSYLRGRCWRIA